MKTYCINCKWATRRWNYTGHWFCTTRGVEEIMSWASGTAEKYAKRCDTLNVDGQCAFYSPSLWVRFRAWVWNG